MEQNSKNLYIDKLKEEIEAALEADKKMNIERIVKRNYKTEKRTSTIAQNIRHYRKANNISQEKLAEMMSCDRGTIINWENGIHIPNALQIEDLAKIFKVDITELHTKQVWNFEEGSSERREIAKREQEWLKNHPVMITKAEEGKNYFNCFDFYRNYCWIGKDGFCIVALELLNRGYKLTYFSGAINDLNGSLFEDEFSNTMVIYLEKGQIESFEDAVSEILIDYASNTSRFDNVIKVRKKYLEKYYNNQGNMDGFLEDYVEELIKESRFDELFISAKIIKEDEELVFVGTLKAFADKLEELGRPEAYCFDYLLSGYYYETEAYKEHRMNQ